MAAIKKFIRNCALALMTLCVFVGIHHYGDYYCGDSQCPIGAWAAFAVFVYLYTRKEE